MVDTVLYDVRFNRKGNDWPVSGDVCDLFKQYNRRCSLKDNRYERAHRRVFFSR